MRIVHVMSTIQSHRQTISRGIRLSTARCVEVSALIHRRPWKAWEAVDEGFRVKVCSRRPPPQLG